MPPTIKRTYASRQNRNPYPSSPVSTLTSSPTAPNRKRPFEEALTNSSTHAYPPSKRKKVSEKVKPKKLEGKKQKSLTQLHFCIDQTILRTCSACGLSYTKGAPDDEALHRAHCARVQKGMEWGREEDKESIKSGVIEVRSGIKLKDGRKGRIICFRADVGGKIGSKVLHYKSINRKSTHTCR
jgi:N-acetyltransferase